MVRSNGDQLFRVIMVVMLAVGMRKPPPSSPSHTTRLTNNMAGLGFVGSWLVFSPPAAVSSR